MSDQHTPAPWLVTARNPKAPRIRYITAGPGISNELAVIYDGESRPADVALIAAAPDLLAILKAVRDFIDDPQRECPLPTDIASAIRITIAKVEGRS